MRLSANIPTLDQLHRIKTIEQTLGQERVKKCFHRFCGKIDINNSTKGQLQRVIIELNRSMPDYYKKKK